MLAGVAVLLASIIPMSQPYRHAAAWRVAPEHESLVRKALTSAVAVSNMSREDWQRITRPRVSVHQDRTCVALVTHRSDGGGSYDTCYSPSGALIYQRLRGVPFGAEGLWDRFGGSLW